MVTYTNSNNTNNLRLYNLIYADIRWSNATRKLLIGSVQYNSGHFCAYETYFIDS